MTPPPLRIVHVTDSLDPAAGGPPVVVRQLAAAQVERGHEVTLAARLAADPPAVAVPGPAGAGLVGGAGPLRGLVAAADVVHLHGVWDPVLVAAARLARAAGRPYLVTPHGMLDPWSLSQGRWKKRLALALTHRRLLGRAARLHLLNADEERLVGRLRLGCPRVVVPNGVRPPADPPPPGAFRAARPAVGDARYVLFLSRLHPKKGLDVLAEAFAVVAGRFPDVHLVVAGPDGGAESDFRGRVVDHRLDRRVHLVGPLYGPDKWAALGDAACFCLPSRQEGFSMAILEALAAGRPAVVTENCHFPEVGTSGAGVVTRLDPGAVADGLGRVLADPAAAGRMGEAGRRLVAAEYTWDRVAGRLEQVYRDALGR